MILNLKKAIKVIDTITKKNFRKDIRRRKNVVLFIILIFLV